MSVRGEGEEGVGRGLGPPTTDVEDGLGEFGAGVGAAEVFDDREEGSEVGEEGGAGAGAEGV